MSTYKIATYNGYIDLRTQTNNFHYLLNKNFNKYLEETNYATGILD